MAATAGEYIQLRNNVRHRAAVLGLAGDTPLCHICHLAPRLGAPAAGARVHELRHVPLRALQLPLGGLYYM